MKVAIASTGKWLDSMVDRHTGRAACFVFYDTDLESHEAIHNLRCNKCRHWAGSQTSDILVNYGVDAVIVSKIGPCAFRKLSSAQIPVFLVDEIPVVSAIRRLRDGELTRVEEPNCKGHSHLHRSD